jgi:hypothetical protein
MSFSDHTVPHQPLYDKAIAKRRFIPDDVATMGLEFWDVATTNQHLGFGNFPSIKIPYFGFDGKPTGFVRVRKLLDDSRMKYSQPRSTGIGIYLTPTVEWEVVARDISKPIIITEGEFKAWVVQKAAGSDYSCLGLGGVSSWGSKTGKPLHDDLMRIKWSKRHGMEAQHRDVYIVFDYDGKGQDGEPNPQVAMAEAKLATVLKGLGARVHVCRVGRFAPDAKLKYAIDDHLDSGGELGDALASTAVILSKDDDLSTKLYEFGTKFGFFNGDVVRLADGYGFTYQKALVDAAPNHIQIPAPTQADPNKTKKVYLLVEAKDSARRTVIHGVGMYPRYQGMQITPDGCYNLFQDWAHQPVEGDVTPFLELCRYFFQADPTFEDFYHDWVAHVLQKPWLRHSTTIQFVSPEEGIGKSYMAELVAELIGIDGTNCGAAVLGPDEIFSQWSDRLAGKIFVVVNEPSSDRANHAKQLKHFITSPKISINKKYGAAYSIDNYVNYMFTTNEPFVTQMSDGSRREAIYTPDRVERAVIGNMIGEFKKWLADGGYGKLLNWYLNRDISGFNHTLEAPDTQAKRDAQEASMTATQVVAKQFVDWVRDECGGAAMMLAETRSHLIEKLTGEKAPTTHTLHRALTTYCEVKKVKWNGEFKKESGYHYIVKGAKNVELSPQRAVKMTDDVLIKWVA